MEKTYTFQLTLVDRVNAKLSELKCTKQELALHLNENRSSISNYLNMKHEKIAKVRIEEIETKLEDWLRKEGEAFSVSMTPSQGEATPPTEAPATQTVPVKSNSLKKMDIFETRDLSAIIGLCNSAQETHGLGIVVGKSGYGKTYALKHYAKLPRVIHIECNEAMNCKDIVRKIERGIGLPKNYGSIDERLEHICNFFNMNQGYLLIVDEADKLISKYTQKKIEILRYISDGAAVGVVIAGEPFLESAIKNYDPRFANRMDLYYKLRGLAKDEVQEYFNAFEMDDAAMEEFYIRACNTNTGCFRLLDRTLNNVIRILKESGKNVITLGVIREASNMMML
ncbi:MAG: ATP-binding protein [Bacteroidales bacterium]|nr:ATP-binding protein [Bacteroidales bacterium]